MGLADLVTTRRHIHLIPVQEGKDNQLQVEIKLDQSLVCTPPPARYSGKFTWTW